MENIGIFMIVAVVAVAIICIIAFTRKNKPEYTNPSVTEMVGGRSKRRRTLTRKAKRRGGTVVQNKNGSYRVISNSARCNCGNKNRHNLSCSIFKQNY